MALLFVVQGAPDLALTQFAIETLSIVVFLLVFAILVTAPSAGHFVGRAAYRAEGVDIRLDGHDDLRTLTDDDAPS